MVSITFCSTPIIGEYGDSTDIFSNTRSRSSETHYVGPGLKYTTIQDAIEISNPGDTIRVDTNTYYENLVIDKPITLIGNDTGNIIIEGGGSGDVIFITADWVNVTGFTITNSGTQPDKDAGIELENVQNCYIHNNYFISNGQYGILLKSSNNNIIAKNTISSNINDGIHLSTSNQNTINENTLKSNRAGISIKDSNSNLIINNVISSNRWSGIYLVSSSNNCIDKNDFNNNFDNKGIYIYRSTNNVLTNNTFINDSVLIDGPVPNQWNSHSIDRTNTVNGKPIIYWKNRYDGTVPKGAGQVILSSCVGITIQNQIISKVYIGILLGFSSNNMIINNKVSFSNQCGISLQNSQRNYISNNIISSTIIGINLFASDQNNIIGNTVSDNIDGIFICCQSESNTIQNNLVDLNNNGIRITSTTKTDITNNICSYNQNGISIGIKTKSTTLTNNTVFSNNNYGIYLNKCESTTITDNSVYSNHYYGIYLDNASESIIYNNNFIKNTNHAYDNSVNQWNISKTGGRGGGGNFYSDLPLNDNNNDGFLDEQYTIDGPGNVMDHLPLVQSTGIQLKIITKDVQTIYVQEFFSVNYSAIYPYDSSNNLIWTMKTNAQWLTFSSNKELFGTPEIGEFGRYWINISVSDGIESDNINSTFQVLTNIPPKITTQNDLFAYVDELYSINYTAVDPDTKQNNLIWSLDTNATWLKFSSTQELFGTPSHSDLGYYRVYLEVFDGINNDFIDFMIHVKATKGQLDDKNKIPAIKEISILNNSNNILIDTSDLKITFSKTMNISNIEKNLKIIPDTDYSVQWGNNNTELRIIFNKDLKYITTYQISIEVEDIDQQGNDLEETFTLTFTTVIKQKADRPEGQNENIQILSYIGVLVIVLIILFFLFILKNRRLHRKTESEKITVHEGQNEFKSPNMIDKYPYAKVAKGISEKYMKVLLNEALEFKKPSEFKISEYVMLKEAKMKFKEGKISKATLDSINNEIGDIKEQEELRSKISEDYINEEISLGNSEEYMKKLMDEALEFKKPSEFLTPGEKMLNDAEEKLKGGQISKTTYDSIMQTLSELENLD